MREALRGRSGNQPAPGGHLRTADTHMASSGQPWSRTRAALGRLERALSCSRCAGVLRQPVSLGQCEHVFCLNKKEQPGKMLPVSKGVLLCRRGLSAACPCPGLLLC